MNTALEFKNDTSISTVTFKGFGEVIDQSRNIIKVVGVGGGGSNAVKNMVNVGLTNVSYALVNTDSQALKNATVPTKIQIGDKGLGVGGDPAVGREAAEFSIDEIKHLFEDNTKMVFITAGMGGGTGTGASPVIARVAREKGILTVGVVTLPFKFEKQQRIDKALKGVAALKEEVDSLIVINNERLIEICDDANTSIEDALKISDQVVTTATRSIAEIITEEGLINRDFCDVRTVLQDGGAAIMSSGRASGENRLVNAMCQALNSPMLNKTEITKSQKLLYIVYQSHEKSVRMPELNEINAFMEKMAPDLEVLWGLYYDDTLGDEVRVDIVATGFDKVRDSRKDEYTKAIDDMRKYYYNDNTTITSSSDIVTELKKKYDKQEETEETSDISLGFDETDEDLSENTDDTSACIISFDDEETEAIAETFVTATPAPEPMYKPIQAHIDFGSDESSSIEDLSEDALNKEAKDEVGETVEETPSTTPSQGKFDYYINQFKTFFDKMDKMITEN